MITLGQKLQAFFRSDIAGGVVLALSALLAMVVANSPLSAWYHQVLETPIVVTIGAFSINKDASHWINDGLMAVFFFLVGLELKREVLVGELSEFKKIILPAIAAVGGMLVPGAIYAVLNYQNPIYLHGWAIPAATDIAFALGVLSLLGNRVPLALKVFLASIAIFDDIGAILIIALFYSEGLSWYALSVVAVTLCVLFVMNRLNVTRTTAYALIGLVMWAAVLKSGIHATLAGVLLALFIPMVDHRHPEHSPLETLEHDLQETVTFVVLPIFAFANAGVYLANSGLHDLTHTVPLGIALGLVLGKPIGVLLFSWLGVKAGLASLPKQVDWQQVLGVSLLCGIGFTMSLFIGGLAFSGKEVGFDERLGIILGSLMSGVLGYFYLKKVLPKSVTHERVVDEEDHSYIQ